MKYSLSLVESLDNDFNYSVKYGIFDSATGVNPIAGYEEGITLTGDDAVGKAPYVLDDAAVSGTIYVKATVTPMNKVGTTNVPDDELTPTTGDITAIAPCSCTLVVVPSDTGGTPIADGGYVDKNTDSHISLNTTTSNCGTIYEKAKKIEKFKVDGVLVGASVPVANLKPTGSVIESTLCGDSKTIKVTDSDFSDVELVPFFRKYCPTVGSGIWDLGVQAAVIANKVSCNIAANLKGTKSGDVIAWSWSTDGVSYALPAGVTDGGTLYNPETAGDSGNNAAIPLTAQNSPYFIKATITRAGVTNPHEVIVEMALAGTNIVDSENNNNANGHYADSWTLTTDSGATTLDTIAVGDCA